MNTLPSSDYICGTQIQVNTDIHINKSSTKMNKDKYYTEGQTQPFAEAAWICLKKLLHNRFRYGMQKGIKDE